MNDQSQGALLTEIAWEVCNQIGGIYTVLRSKTPAVINTWGNQYCAIGPYFQQSVNIEFEEAQDYSDHIGQAVLKMREMGFAVYAGTWLVSGRPKVVLIDPQCMMGRVHELKYFLYEQHHIEISWADDLLHQAICFAYICKEFLKALCSEYPGKVLAHFHEWLVGIAIPQLRQEKIPATLIFTTHATLLGRYLAMNDSNFYDRLSYFQWEAEAKKYNIEAQVKLERAAAHGSHIFTTISQVTARECEVFLGRRPDYLLPNGINIERFTAMHEHQVLHQNYKEQIHEFVMGHFFQSYSFDLDNTLYFFTSGRYEYRNKGFDLCIEALARLNAMLKNKGVDKTVVMFFITKRPFYSINPDVLHSRAMMEETRQVVENIQKKMGVRLFHSVASKDEFQMPDLNTLVDDFEKLKLRRIIQAWKAKRLPLIVTHNLIDNTYDELLNFIRQTNLVNAPSDRVKIVYHPDFLSTANPLFGMDYSQFVRGCHLGIFPSYYEPWGYTPLECLASGVPSVTSDLSGFGNYVAENIPNYTKKGFYVLNRYHRDFNVAAQSMADMLFDFCIKSRRERINQRNKVEALSEDFDWKKLLNHYNQVYTAGLKLK